MTGSISVCPGPSSRNGMIFVDRTLCHHGFFVISPMFATVSPFFIEGTAQI